jgi:hypothetical protein
VKVCPCCGHVDRSQFRASRFDFDAEYMRFDEAVAEVPKVVQFLKDKPNFFPYYAGHGFDLVYYRRGTGGLWLYRVLKENFRVPRERKRHKVEALVTQPLLSFSSVDDKFTREVKA